MPKGTDDPDADAIKWRVKVVRQFVAGDSQTKMALQLGITPNRWNNFERGSPLSKDVAITLVRKIHGLTLDWLYLGIPDGMPSRLQRELEAAEMGLITAEGRASEPTRKPSTKSRA